MLPISVGLGGTFTRILTYRNDVAGSNLMMYMRDKKREGEWKEINAMRDNLNLIKFIGYMIRI
jgi:hypothetical protein